MRRIPFSDAAVGRSACCTRAGLVPPRAWARGAIAVLGATLASLVNPASAQELEHAIRQPWALYVFVSSRMPHQSLVALAREARQAHATMVFRGFQTDGFNLAGQQQFVAQLNEECCAAAGGALGVPAGRRADAPAGPAWSIDPSLYRRFAVDVVPSFVLAANGATGDQSFSKVAGDMALASALKFFAQRSAIGSVRQQAATLYQSTYGGRE